MCKLLMSFILFASAAFAKEVELQQKIYIQPDQISLKENMLFVLIGNHWVPTESIHVDPNGIYVYDEIRDILHWICPKCGYENGLFDKHCQSCGY